MAAGVTTSSDRSQVRAREMAYLGLLAMRVLGVSRTVPLVYCVPFVTATMTALILGEELNYYQADGGGFIFSGLLLALDRRGVAE